MSKKRKGVWTIVLCIMCALVVLCACGGPEKPPEATTAEEPGAAPTAALEQEELDLPVAPAAVTQLVEGSRAPKDPMLAFDGQGILHLVWGEEGAFWHKARTPDGEWSEAQVLTEDFETLYGLVELLPRPSGEICVFFDAATVSVQPSTAGLYMRCYEGGEWQPISDRIPGDYTPTFPLAVAFSPKGKVQVLHSTGPGRAPVVFAGMNLSPEEGFVDHLQLVTDRKGQTHAMWQRKADDTRIEYRSSITAGRMWSSLDRQIDTPPLSLIADAEGHLHGAGWAGAEGVYYKNWTGLRGWEAAVDVSGDTPGGASGDLAVGPDGLAHIVWENQALDVRHYVWQLDGDSWSKPLLVVGEKATALCIAVDGQGDRHFVWAGVDGGLYYAVVQ